MTLIPSSRTWAANVAVAASSPTTLLVSRPRRTHAGAQRGASSRGTSSALSRYAQPTVASSRGGAGGGVVAVDVGRHLFISARLAGQVAGLGERLAPGDVLVVAATPDAFEVPFGADRLEYLTGVPASIVYLLVGDGPATFAREDEHTLSVRTTAPGLCGSWRHRLLLGGQPPRAGRRFGGRGLTAEVAEVEAGRPCLEARGGGERLVGP